MLSEELWILLQSIKSVGDSVADGVPTDTDVVHGEGYLCLD